jgi:hypothetical protein
MTRAKISTYLAIALAGLAGTAAADTAVDRRPPIDARRLPLECKQFLATPTGQAGNPWLLWENRLSIAACRQRTTLIAPVTDPEKLRSMVAMLENAIEPSVAIYQDAIANAPARLRILAAYGLGRTYIDLVVRARATIPGGGEIMDNLALADRYAMLHRTLEPLLVRDRQRAVDAFAEAVRLAEAAPEEVSANKVMTDAVAASHVLLERLGNAAP